MTTAENRMDTLRLIAGISWRNVWRNKRRTLLTFLTIMAGCSMILLMRSFQNGGYSQMIEDAIAPLPAHIQIHEKGFWKNSSLEYSFADDSELLGRIRQVEHVLEVSRRIQNGGLVIFGDSSAGAEVIGIEPSPENRITTLHRYLLAGGKFLADDDLKSVVLGDGLARNIGVKPGDTVSLLSQGFDGSIAAGDFTVSGIFHSPNVAYNTGLVLMNFKEAEEIFSMSGYVTSYVVRIDDTYETWTVKSKIASFAGDGLEVMAWDELVPEIIQFIAMDKASSHMFVFILYLLVAFGILNTVQMSVYERIREIGIMISIGTTPGRVFAMVMTEALITAVMGLVAGLLCGGAICWYFTLVPIDFSSYGAEMEFYGVSTLVWYGRMRAGDFISCSITIFFLTILFTFFPARRASRLDPVRAIRHL